MARMFTENVPIYLQLIEFLKIAVIRGEYRQNDRLPPVRELAEQYGVNPNTVQRAYSELEREGIVQSERTAGRFLSIDDSRIEQLKKEISDGYISELFSRMHLIGLNDDQIRKMVNDFKEEEG
ncbi:MAG: GntR family transcriptional regulator [Erysipelotrichaceae bacterium]|nr:GntR family transcriptional regulator [Erysipelotrichaceae bacterium]